MKESIKNLREKINGLLNSKLDTKTIDEIKSVSNEVEKISKEIDEIENEHVKLKEKYIDVLKNYPVDTEEHKNTNEPKTTDEILAEIEEKYRKENEK